MAVKVEMERNDEAKMIAFRFTSSNEEDLDILDAIRVAMFGDHEKRGTYTNSSTLVIQVKTE